ncbi:MAG: type II secretion system F family protein [Acidimicrobiales bacterium]
MSGAAGSTLIIGLWMAPAGWLWRRRPHWVHGPEPVVGLVVAALVLWRWWPAAWLVPGLWVTWRGGQRIRQVGQRKQAHGRAADRAAELASLLELALQGGVSLRRALDDVHPWVLAPLGPALATALGRVQGGAALSDELEALVQGPHPELDGLWRLLRAVERDGAPAAPALAALTAEARLERRHRLERSARRLPLRLLGPLVGGVLPAFVLLAVVPMLAGALAGLRSP